MLFEIKKKKVLRLGFLVDDAMSGACFAFFLTSSPIK